MIDKYEPQYIYIYIYIFLNGFILYNLYFENILSYIKEKLVHVSYICTKYL